MSNQPQEQTISYIHWLRDQIGSRKVPLIAACACIRDEQGRLLWQHRGDFGWWGLPGGIIEVDESLTECVVREAWEETGLHVEPLHFVGVYSSPTYDAVYPNGDKAQFVTYVYSCRVTGGALHADGDETLGLQWLGPDELPETSVWYADFAADLFAGHPAACFRSGVMGARTNDIPLHKEIRPIIGHAPWIMPTAAGFVLDDDDRLLLMRRSDTGEWSLPGGMLELGERLDLTAISEVREETGLDVEVEHLIGVYSGPECFITYPHGDQCKYINTLFRCRVVGGALRADGVESTDVRFFARDDLPSVTAHHVQRIEDGFACQEAAVFK